MRQLLLGLLLFALAQRAHALQAKAKNGSVHGPVIGRGMPFFRITLARRRLVCGGVLAWMTAGAWVCGFGMPRTRGHRRFLDAQPKCRNGRHLGCDGHRR